MLWLFISRVQCISKRENTQNVKSWAVGEHWKKGRTGVPPLRICCKLKWYLYNRHVKWLKRKGDQFWCESGLTWLKLDLNCAVRACVVSKISFSLLSSSFALTRESLNAIAAHFLFKILNMGISGFHTARLACLILRTRSRMIDVNCQNWPITACIPERGIVNNAYRLTSPSFPSPHAVFAQRYSIRFFPTILELWSETLLRMQIKVRD